MAELVIDQEVLARFVPMSSLAPSYLHELSNHASVVELEPNDTLDEELRTVEFIHYLLEGELSLSGGGAPDVLIKASDSTARFALAGTESVGRHARAVSAAKLLRLERAKISTLLIWAQVSSDSATSSALPALRDDVTALLMHSRLFARIPPSNIERIGQLIEPVQVSAGEFIVRQGEVGDFYFIIDTGRCEVLREQGSGHASLRLAQLSNGESFGEEALITDSPRNASVRMMTDGVLLRLTRDYFIELISAPLLHEVSHERAEDLTATGARWIDVRLREEFERDGLDEAIHIPLGELRARLKELPKGGSYITVCNSGRRAQAGAFLLTQLGLHACSLRDGIATRRPQKRGIRAEQENLGTLQVDLLRANAALEDALKAKAHADAAQEAEAKALHSSTSADDASRRLRDLTDKTEKAGGLLRAAMQRKRELESSIRDVQAREASAQRAAQTEMEAMRARTQTRLEEEKQRLSERYRQASAQLEQVEQAQREAERRFAEERARIEQELAQAQRKMDAEAKRIRQAIEQAKSEAEHKAKSIRSEHQQLEDDLRQRTSESLRHEREHLEEAFSRSIADQERARQNMELAEAERIEAEKESERLRAATESELRQRHEREQQARDAQLRELQAASEAARRTLEQAQRARDEAQALHQRSNATLTGLAGSTDPQREQALRDEIALASLKLASADDELDQAQLEHTRAAQAEQVAEQTQVAAASREDELRVQLYEEMQEWIEEEHSRNNDELEQAAQYARELERIHAAKEKKRQEDLHADQNMLSDIENMLKGEASVEPLNNAMRTHTIVEEKARLLQRAKQKISEDAARARAAMNNSGKQ